ncbi:hypothetical protein [Paenibacillus sp. MBLB4367]|uniref:hypothetical protein n=1 Tax=Paenibacillus sp. MBLB4367 TaxID=3384767 RepID=UPI0039081E64
MNSIFRLNHRLREYLNFDSLRRYLRSSPLNSSGTKPELIQRIEEGISSGELDKNDFESFLANEIRYGHNRTLYCTRINPASLFKVKNSKLIKQAMMTAGLSECQIINNIHFTPDSDEPVLVHFEKSEIENGVQRVIMCFASMVMISKITDENESIQVEDTDYVWITIDVPQGQLTISVRPRSNTNETSTRSYQVFEIYTSYLTEVFSLRYLSNDEMKNTLYNIFRELTTKAEKPYVEKVEPLLSEISDLSDRYATFLGLPSSNNPVNLPFRIRRLLERALIQNDFFNFKGYSEGKIGTVEKFFYSDDTGARVNASANDGEGIEVCDIYFDTRETIDDQKTFNKLWINWFIPGASVGKKTYTKLEATTKYFVIHFYSYHSEVEQEYVFSSIETFRAVPN